ncbi:MAG: D-glucuronyl C5-epimerase family protein [Actinomycetota bacterium]|nr:D-glucuronyl C5-epimerase family protein [Actinomycetota bacterium]
MTAIPDEERAKPSFVTEPDLRPGHERGRLERFLSRSFGAPYGRNVDPQTVRGYPIDFRGKANRLEMWPGFHERPGSELWVGAIQRGLGCHERWVEGEGEEWLDSARKTADLLVAQQRDDGTWMHTFHYPHTFAISPPWPSGMAQGEGASLLVRMHGATGEESYRQAALRALEPLYVPSDEGGAAAALDGGLVPEEYPTDPPSLVLNGLMFGLWGLRDVAVGLGDERARAGFDSGVDALVRCLGRWDTGNWSRYDLFPHRVTNVASTAYHLLHITQLDATGRLARRPELVAAAWRWVEYAELRRNRGLAFARKALFRLAEPRSARVARILPWVRGGEG